MNKRGSIGVSTISSQFRQKLSELMNELESSSLHFIRCIKPNDEHIPKKWDVEKVRNQLNYCGITSALKIARQTLPIRTKKELFNKKYGILFKKTALDDILLSNGIMSGKTMYFYTKATEAKLQELLDKEIKRVFEVFFGVVARLRPRQQYSDTYLALQKINGAIIFRKSFQEMRKRKRERQWENIVGKIITNIHAGILLKVRQEVYSYRIGYFIKRRVQQSDYNRKLFFMKKIILFLRRRAEQIRYISEYNIYKNSREAELNELRCDLLNEKQIALNELEAHLLNAKDAEFNKLKEDLLNEKDAELNKLKEDLLNEKDAEFNKLKEDLLNDTQKESELKELESRLLKEKESALKELESRRLKEKEYEFDDLKLQLLKQKESELKELESRLIKVNESNLQRYRDSLRQEQNRLEEQKWLLLQQIETEFTTAKESEIKKSFEEEFNEYKRLIGEKMVQLQIENMELKDENMRLVNSIKSKKWTFLDRLFSNSNHE
jgi:myosin-5